MKNRTLVKRGISRVATAVVVVVIVIIAAAAGVYVLTLPKGGTTTITQTQTQSGSVTTASGTVTLTTTATASGSSSATTSSSVSTTSSAPSGNQTFVVNMLSGGSGLDPTYALEPTVTSNIYERLAIIAPNGTVLPQLATSWTVAPNGTQWTFNLRQGVLFQDGSLFNSSAVAFTFTRQKDLVQGQTTVVSQIASIVAVDPYTVVINTVKSVPLPLYMASEQSTWITTPNAFNYAGIKTTGNATQDQINLENWFNAGHSDGTGPYQVVTSLYNAQSSVTLVRFSKYWGGWKPNQANTVIFNTVNSGTLALQEMAAGQADLFGSPTVSQLPLVNSSSNVKLVSGTNVAVQMLWYNVNNYPLNNTLVRQALSYAIPYQDIINNVYGGQATPAVGWIAPGVFGHDNNASSFNFNMTMAHNLLKEAGFSSGAISPARTLTVLLYVLYPETTQTWSLIQPDWAELGLNVNLLVVGSSTLISTIKGANPPDVVGLRWSPSCMSAGCPLLDNWGNSSFVNFANWQNNTFTGIVQQALSVEGSNPSQSLSLFSQAQQMLFQNAPGVVMVNLNTLFVLNSHWSIIPGAVAFEPNEISNTFFVYAVQYS
ncbi:MAG TPA: ABC transporter substrate-binding protein [Nitrososphaerales archaeon]|nr:ABC transporter substrate-binding protein [Nitrososphaerales archaeon]